MRNPRNYETDDAAFPAAAYAALGWGAGIAWSVLGWETEPDEDTEWSGMENHTGRVLACMIGDDSVHAFDFDDLTPLDRADYCGECGQVGCAHDGYHRDGED